MLNTKNKNFGAFLGAFVSEGNMPEYGAIKITNKNKKFIEFATSSIKRVLGEVAATNLPPTSEHKDGDEGYHKFYSTAVRKVLIENFAVKPGKRIINNEGLPEIIMKNLYKPKEQLQIRNWMKSYIQTRYSGDGEIRRKRKQIVLTKDVSLKIEPESLESIQRYYRKGKKLESYPEYILDVLKTKMKNPRNCPKEFKDLQKVFKISFSIESKIFPSGVRTIYYDKKRNIMIVSVTYRLIISHIENIKKFYEKINFPPFDKENINKLKSIVTRYSFKAE